MQIHENQEIIYSGKSIDSEDYVMIMIHGRGATASDIIGLEQHISQKEKIAFIAP